MMTRALTLLLVIGAAAPGVSQGVQIDVVSTKTSHGRIGDPLRGLGILGRPFRSERLAWRLGAEFSGSTSSSLRSPCYGLVEATQDCSPDPMQDRGRLFMATTGIDLRALTIGPLSVGAFGDVGVGRLSLRTRPEPGSWGTASSKAMLNVLAGAALGLEVPGGWSIRASAARGSIAPWTVEYVIDGYTPFSGGFNTTRLAIGAAWARRD